MKQVSMQGRAIKFRDSMGNEMVSIEMVKMKKGF